MNIVLIVGGFSSEREVSLASGRSILKALRENGHNVKVIDPVLNIDSSSEDIIFNDIISKEYPTRESLIELKNKTAKNIFRYLGSEIFDNVDIVFIGLHGKFGEDGSIQALLDTRGIKYTGSNMASSSLAMNKHFSKNIFNQYKILTPKWFIQKRIENIKVDSLLVKIKNEFGFPCVIKPNDEGSTVGLTILENDDKNNLVKALELGFKYTNTLIFEEYIKGRELTVPIIGNKPYPVIEVKPKDGFYDYHHKYTKGMTEYICPAEISEEQKEILWNNAIIANDILGCEVYSRVDFLLTDSGMAYCLEVNTLPGMTSLSLVPKSANVAGLGFNELIELIIELSLKKK